MKKLGLLLLLACAACTKKPAAKPPTPPPAEPTESDKAGEPKPDATNVPRTGDPCDGGQKPK